jgi:hypothetical protein
VASRQVPIGTGFFLLFRSSVPRDGDGDACRQRGHPQTNEVEQVVNPRCWFPP